MYPQKQSERVQLWIYSHGSPWIDFHRRRKKPLGDCGSSKPYYRKALHALSLTPWPTYSASTNTCHFLASTGKSFQQWWRGRQWLRKGSYAHSYLAYHIMCMPLLLQSKGVDFSFFFLYITHFPIYDQQWEQIGIPRISTLIREDSQELEVMLASTLYQEELERLQDNKLLVLMHLEKGKSHWQF